ncbi:MAG TPA: efflux RND transporter periplasmic adaptor subunit [Steroidobacteraceae bacterium]|nr:efflux RND transporter periplasmic adaptor subunit [Steroidobacteraceae bacterium]
MIVLLAAGVLLGLLVGFNLFKSYMIRKALAQNASPPQTVTAGPAEYSDWQPTLGAVGSVRAVRGVDITTEVAGLVRSIRLRSGEEVGAGQVLVELNADSDRAQLNALQATADLSAVTVGRARAQYAVQAIAKSDLDADEADLKAKRAQVAAQAAIVAKKMLRAPFAGRLGITTVNPGQYLNPGDKVVTLQTLDPIFVDFRLPQGELARVSKGQTVHVTSDSYPGEGFTGKVTAIDPRVDAASRNFQVEALVQNRTGHLVPGMFARVSVASGGTQRYLTLPQTAINYNPYGATLFLVKDAAGAVAKATSGTQVPGTQAPGTQAPSGAASPAHLTVEQRFVTLGPKRGDQVAVIRGVDAGDLVVTSGQMKLKNGTPIIIDNSVVPANDAHPSPQEE